MSFLHPSWELIPAGAMATSTLWLLKAEVPAFLGQFLSQLISLWLFWHRAFPGRAGCM